MTNLQKLLETDIMKKALAADVKALRRLIDSFDPELTEPLYEEITEILYGDWKHEEATFEAGTPELALLEEAFDYIRAERL